MLKVTKNIKMTENTLFIAEVELLCNRLLKKKLRVLIYIINEKGFTVILYNVIICNIYCDINSVKEDIFVIMLF